MLAQPDKAMASATAANEIFMKIPTPS